MIIHAVFGKKVYCTNQNVDKRINKNRIHGDLNLIISEV